MEARRAERVVRVLVRVVVREVDVEWRERMRALLAWWVDTEVLSALVGGGGRGVGVERSRDGMRYSHWLRPSVRASSAARRSWTAVTEGL